MKNLVSKYPLTLLLFIIVIAASCNKDDNTKEAKTKQIEWELFHAFSEPNVKSFEISDDGGTLYYSVERNVYKLNLATGERETILTSNGQHNFCYVHLGKNNKIYVVNGYEYRGYFNISSDDGNTWQTYQTGEYTSVSAGMFTGAYVQNHLNRLYELPNGTLLLPDIVFNGKAIATSEDGGVTWSSRTSEFAYIGAVQNNRLFGVANTFTTGTGTGTTSNLSYSDDVGVTWTQATGYKIPIATDRNGDLIHFYYDKIYRRSGDKEYPYEWNNSNIPFLGQFSISSEGISGTGQPIVTRKDYDIEFDAANNMYMLNSDNKIYKTKLN